MTNCSMLRNVSRLTVLCWEQLVIWFYLFFYLFFYRCRRAVGAPWWTADRAEIGIARPPDLRPRSRNAPIYGTLLERPMGTVELRINCGTWTAPNLHQKVSTTMMLRKWHHHNRRCVHSHLNYIGPNNHTQSFRMFLSKWQGSNKFGPDKNNSFLSHSALDVLAHLIVM